MSPPGAPPIVEGVVDLLADVDVERAFVDHLAVRILRGHDDVAPSLTGNGNAIQHLATDQRQHDGLYTYFVHGDVEDRGLGQAAFEYQVVRRWPRLFAGSCHH